ncbi:hypothetical protein M2368_003534 [Arthrobacter sp. JUb119]|uniref:hypothetical protein n=1 Tax=Arthrobacter sp. JUb115 TaxID=2485108 RepID=UPI001414E7C1|nr:hypothetical protein [Arthrobacter sp. JUb115]MCS3494502.1 hypothetical protein [Arthrobacter sp. JUb119]
MMDAEDDGESKVISGKLTSAEQGILFALVAACDLIERLRPVTERHTGAAFTRQERKLMKPNLNPLVPAWMGGKAVCGLARLAVVVSQIRVVTSLFALFPKFMQACFFE